VVLGLLALGEQLPAHMARRLLLLASWAAVAAGVGAMAAAHTAGAGGRRQPVRAAAGALRPRALAAARALLLLLLPRAARRRLPRHVIAWLGRGAHVPGGLGFGVYLRQVIWGPPRTGSSSSSSGSTAGGWHGGYGGSSVGGQPPQAQQLQQFQLQQGAWSNAGQTPSRSNAPQMYDPDAVDEVMRGFRGALLLHRHDSGPGLPTCAHDVAAAPGHGSAAATAHTSPAAHAHHAGGGGGGASAGVAAAAGGGVSSAVPAGGGADFGAVLGSMGGVVRR
jgi:hypothetical protein